jgi:hypothetical protein
VVATPSRPGPARLGLQIALLGLVLVSAGCAGSRPPTAPQADPGVAEDARAAAAVFRRLAGEHWYALYEEDLKVGWARVRLREHGGLFVTGRRYRIEVDQHLRLQINGYGHKFHNRLQMDFSARAPFELTRLIIREDINDHTARREIRRDGAGGELTVVDGRRQTTRSAVGFDYALGDALAVERWLHRVPAVGQTTMLTYLDPEALTCETGKARMVSLEIPPEHDGAERLFHIEHPPTGLGAIRSVFREDGQLVRRQFPGGLEMRLTSAEEARAPAQVRDLYVRYMLPIETTIGRSDEVRRVEFATDAVTFRLLSNAPGQWVTRDGNGFRIILERGAAFPETAFPGEIEKALEVPPALNRKGASLLKSAREALAGIEDRQTLVEQLLIFVDEAVEDSNEIISPNLAYALEKQKGDCSEHAALFEALARAFDIPCRMVSGLVYMGDWAQSFGLHAWNEVVFEDRWHPVDVTRRSMQLPPFYIRFPLDTRKQNRLFAHIARMEIDVLKVDHATANE